MRCFKPIFIKNPRDGVVNSIPCGKCAACLTNKREGWTIRLKEEAKASIYNYFITLTYDNQHLTYGAEAFPTLVKEDLQRFFKRFRKLFPPKAIRYYAVGEYGTKTYRPHYHILLFSTVDISDNQVYVSWGKGNIVHSSCSVRRIVYTTKFHVLKGEYPSGCAPPFSLMSKGIGKSYLTKNVKKYHRSSLKNCYYQFDGWKKTLPRYYRNKIYNKIDLEAIKSIIFEKHNNYIKEDEYLKKYPLESFFKAKNEQNLNFEKSFKDKVSHTHKF